MFVVHSPREPPKKERMAKVNKMEKQVNNLEKNVGKDSKVREAPPKTILALFGHCPNSS